MVISAAKSVLLMFLYVHVSYLDVCFIFIRRGNIQTRPVQVFKANGIESNLVSDY